METEEIIDLKTIVKTAIIESVAFLNSTLLHERGGEMCITTSKQYAIKGQPKHYIRITAKKILPIIPWHLKKEQITTLGASNGICGVLYILIKAILTIDFLET